MADFNRYFPTLLKHEGGFVNHPNDPGGATNLGITLRTLQAHSRLINVSPTLNSLKRLTPAQASVIYKVAYWDKIYGDKIPYDDLAYLIFDFYVNAGGNAIKELQTTLIALGANIKADGAMGPNTLNAILQQKNPNRLYRAYLAKRRSYYINLAFRKPKLRVFINGWLNRINQFPDQLRS